MYKRQVISPEIVQINLKILKEGVKKLSEIFPDQNKPKEQPKKEKEETTEHQPKQEEQPKEEKKEVNQEAVSG